MFTRCLICSTPFPANDALEHFPRGERVAYDPGKGRLWAVCTRCKRWTLAPIEERWEALEELERLVTDRGKLLSRTDNVALMKAGPLEVVRVGSADLTEQAWWRYGRVLLERRQSYRKITAVGSVAVGAAIVGGWATGGISGLAAWILWRHVPRRKFADAARWLHFGSAAWRGREACPRCGHLFLDLPYADRKRIVVRPGDDDEELPSLIRRCPRCGDRERGGLRLEGPEAERALRRVLAYHHYAGASEKRVRSASRLVQEAGRPGRLARIVAKDGRPIGDLPRTGLIALEIAANEEVEQRWLELEVAELEAQWRVEEELASIVDGELTPMPMLETIRRKVLGIEEGSG